MSTPKIKFKQLASQLPQSATTTPSLNQMLKILSTFIPYIMEIDLPSHIAHADIPLDQNCCSEGSSSLLAVAPVAIITVCAQTSRSELLMVKGLYYRSTSSTSSKYNSEPHLSACKKIKSQLAYNNILYYLCCTTICGYQV